jgi:hypothetical protein
VKWAKASCAFPWALSASQSAGAKVDFVAEGDGFKVVPVRNQVSSLKGRFAGRTAKPVSLEAMDLAIVEGALEKRQTNVMKCLVLLEVGVSSTETLAYEAA